MSGILGGGSNQDVKPAYTGLQINTAVSYLPVPICLGWGKLSPNLIAYTDFASHPQHDSQGGKGGDSPTTGYKYNATILFGLCEGIVGPETGKFIWKDRDYTSVAKEGMTLFSGTANQEPWGYLASSHPDMAFPYNDTAYAAAANYDLQGSPDTPNLNFLTYGPLAGTGVSCTPAYNMTIPTGYPALGDADPVLCAQAVLTDPRFGVPDFPAGAIDTASWFFSAAATTTGDSSWQTYCWANGLSISAFITDQEAASDILARYAQLTNTALFWSEGKLKAVPYGDTGAGNYGYVFKPNVTPVYDLTDLDYVRADNDDPVLITRVDPADVYNCYRLEWLNCYNYFNAEPIEDKEQSLIEDYGLRIASTIQGHEITVPQVAETVVSLIKNRGCYIRRNFKFKLSAEYFLLEPMDLVTLTDPDLGLAQVAIRIIEIEEDEKGEFAITAEEFPAGIAKPALYGGQAITNQPLNTNVAAQPVNVPVIFEPSAALAKSGSGEVWIAASGGSGGEVDPNWGGAQIWLSTDNVTYEQVGTIDAPVRQGVLTAPLPAFGGANPDTGDTLAVNLNESGGALVSGTAADAAASRTLCWVDGELVAYTTATLTAITYAVSEAQTVPAAPGPYAIDSNFRTDWTADLGVSYAGGGALTKVTATPATGQYAVAGGVYSFAAGDAGAEIVISYDRTGPGYSLTGLYRGLYGTTPAAHAAGAQFARLDSMVFVYPLPPAYVGTTLYLKLVSFNAWGKGIEDISTVAPVTYVPAGTGFYIAPPV